MKNNKILLPMIIFFVVVISLILAGQMLNQKDYSASSGKIYKANDTVYLIDRTESAMIVSDYSKNKNLFQGYNNGDKVIVFHGLIEETYPSHTDAYFAFRFAKGDGTYKPDDSVVGIFKPDYNKSDTPDHTHSVAEKEQIVDDPFEGYCGNTQTTIYFSDTKSFTFMYGESVTVTDILLNLNYKKNKLCKCLSEYTVDTEFGKGYGVNLTEGYARCEKGQADLSKEQIEKLSEIILWAEKKA